MAKKSTKSLDRAINNLFYGDCPKCGCSLKGMSFQFIYEQKMKQDKLKEQYKYVKMPRPHLKYFIEHNIDKCVLNDKEREIVAQQVKRHYPRTHQSRLASVVDRENTFYCTECGYTFTIQFEEPQAQDNNQQK